MQYASSLNPEWPETIRAEQEELRLNRRIFYVWNLFYNELSFNQQLQEFQESKFLLTVTSKKLLHYEMWLMNIQKLPNLQKDKKQSWYYCNK